MICTLDDVRWGCDDGGSRAVAGRERGASRTAAGRLAVPLRGRLGNPARPSQRRLTGSLESNPTVSVSAVSGSRTGRTSS